MILREIADYTKLRYQEVQRQIPLSEIKAKALRLNSETGFPFEKALKKQGLSYICEVKKASPSKGIIAENFPYLQIAQDYEKAGAGAISVLTEPKYFMGDNRYLTEISKAVSIPLLRKDFTVCDYQIYEAKTIGASAILLICALLDVSTLGQYFEISHGLGLSAVVEAHDRQEVEKAVSAGARIIGVNNRNLKDFTVNIDNCTALRKYVPGDILYIAESGIKTNSDIEKIRRAGADGVLIGESMMRSPDKAAALRELNGGDL